MVDLINLVFRQRALDVPAEARGEFNTEGIMSSIDNFKSFYRLLSK